MTKTTKKLQEIRTTVYELLSTDDIDTLCKVADEVAECLGIVMSRHKKPYKLLDAISKIARTSYLERRRIRKGDV